MLDRVVAGEGCRERTNDRTIHKVLTLIWLVLLVMAREG